MANRYGPWATLIDTGRNPQLSAFWRRRLTMLVRVSQTNPLLSRRNLLWLGVAAALVCVVPTFHLVAADEPPKPVKIQAKTEKSGPKRWTLPNGTTMWEGGVSSGAPINKEMHKLIAEQKYKFVKTFESGDGEKQYVYQFHFSDGSSIRTNFSMPLDNVSSWDDYQRKVEAQNGSMRHEKINEAIAAGRFRLINVDVMQVHLCRDVATNQKFKVQRIPRSGGQEIAFPRTDYSKIPPSVKETSWQEHLQAIREGKRELLGLETTNNYTYEMTSNDGTKVIFQYGGNSPLEKLGGTKKAAAAPDAGVKTVVDGGGKKDAAAEALPAKSGDAADNAPTETLVGERPRGNCSIGGKIVSAATGKPVDHARMYLHYNITHGSIFIHTASDGTFLFKNIPKGPFSLRSSYTAGYQDAIYNPDAEAAEYPAFSLKDGEHRSGIVLKAKQACRISGKIVDENGQMPENIDHWTVLAWFEKNDGKGYESQQAKVNRADGSYVIDGLDAKPVYVMAINWRAARAGDGYPPIYYPGTFSRTDAKRITFDKSQSLDNIDIKLKKEGGLVIEGTVRDEAGKPVPEAFVVVHRRDMLFDFVTAYTDEEGRYRIQGLGDGEFLVHVDAVHRGFVRTRTPVDLGKASGTTRRDFALARGVLISGKLVDENGKDWQIGESFGYAHTVTKRPDPQGTFSLTNFRNKYRPADAAESSGGSFALGDGGYAEGDMIFPTTSTFVIQGMMPGHTMIGFLPNKERQKVLKILHDGHDIMKSGMNTKPGQEIKDITIVIAKQ